MLGILILIFLFLRKKAHFFFLGLIRDISVTVKCLRLWPVNIVQNLHARMSEGFVCLVLRRARGMGWGWGCYGDKVVS